MKKICIIALILFIGFFSFFIAYQLTCNSTEENIRTSFKEKKEISSPKEDPIETKISTATLLATGDIMFHMPQVKAAYDSNNKKYDFKDVFKYVKKHIDSADLSLANFETVTAGNEIGFSGFPRFNSPEETLEAIKYAGFDILSTANNHSLDQGKKGIINTINAIEKKGMKNIGTYKEFNRNILIEEIDEIKIAFLSYSYGFNGLDNILSQDELSLMVNRIDEDTIKADITEAKDLGVDVVVLFIHWGNEYEKTPSEYQIELGHKMIAWGANIILGSHPHVIQKSEIINYEGKDNFIIYSMGNFLSNQREENVNNKYTEDGVMVKLQLEKDFSKGETSIKDITYIPTWIRRYKNNGLKYEIIPIEDFLKNKEFYSEMNQVEQKRIKESYNNTLEEMDK